MSELRGFTVLACAVLLGCGEGRPPAGEPAQEPALEAVPQTAPEPSSRAVPDSPAAVSDGHTARNSLDWYGTYEGIVPCADCEGIKTVLTLNQDMTYVLTATYVGKSDTPFRHTGTFGWNDAGNTVILSGLTDRPSQYFVSEGYVLQLDMDGKRIGGALADMYRLARAKGSVHAGASAPLIGTTWYLHSLRGKELAVQPDRKRPFLALRPAESRLNGFAGCNTFTGSYATKAPDRLSFSNVAATRMMCPDMEIESMLLDALEETDSYAIREGRLMLHRGRMTPLAVFEAGQGR
jgi:heat shock protein HslJ